MTQKHSTEPSADVDSIASQIEAMRESAYQSGFEAGYARGSEEAVSSIMDAAKQALRPATSGASTQKASKSRTKLQRSAKIQTAADLKRGSGIESAYKHIATKPGQSNNDVTKHLMTAGISDNPLSIRTAIKRLRSYGLIEKRGDGLYVKESQALTRRGEAA